MKKFAVRSDMEGLFGVMSWGEVIPGSPAYEKARRWLLDEVLAMCEGLREGGADYVEIYDEHYYGLNLDARDLPEGVAVIRGKPPYTVNWPGGLNSSFAGLILQGYHAKWGTEGGVLAHTYEPDIEGIWINGVAVGEIGVEAAIAGEAGVPFSLYIGDSHGAEEAQGLVPGVETVRVKEGMGMERGLCRGWPEVRREIVAAAVKIAQNPLPKPLRFDPPIEMRIKLGLGDYREEFMKEFAAVRVDPEHAILNGGSVTEVWARYWSMKDRILERLREISKGSEAMPH